MTVVALPVPEDYLVPETLPEVEPNLWEVGIDDRTADIPWVPKVDNEAVTRTIKKLDRMSDATRDRTIALRLVMASLEGLSFSEGAALLGVREQRLGAWLRGRSPFPSARNRGFWRSTASWPPFTSWSPQRQQDDGSICRSRL